jgi:murein DD-endopeptidase MepM/ murein hydrolase activator NlpD
MLSVVELLRAQPRVLVLAVVAVGIAGCSSESTRFNENPYASRSAPGEATGSVNAQAAPSGRVEQSQLPPPGANGPAMAAAPPTGIAGGGRGLASYQPANVSAPEVTGSVQAPRRPASANQWSWDGGTAVTVAPGDTVDSIAHRHGVPSSAIMQANGLTSPAVIRPGQRLVIPRYNTAAAPTPAPAAAPAMRPVAPAPPRPAATATNSPGMHIVAPGETLSKISRLYGKSIPDLAKANNIEPHATLKIGDRIVIPGVRTSSTAGRNATRVAQAQPLAQAPKIQPASKTQLPKQPEQAQQAAVITQTNETPAPTTSAVKSTDATPAFRWPVKGRVIAGFGPKPNGQQNDGINLAVPEGTPVKAAEDGVVAYAGNELKGYGNLVLIRHPNGYVTAYAHAKELLVKRGDPIKRGQTIANSGQTGNVDAPQLHFEVRKGPAPLDPLPMLNGG